MANPNALASDQKLQQWEALMDTDPARVIRALGLTADDAKSPEGDNPLDMYAALTVLNKEASGVPKENTSDAADGSSPNEPTARWQKLVELGVTEALCKCVLNIQPLFRPQAGAPEAIIERAKAQLRSSYYSPLEVLCLAATNFHSPPTPTDKRSIQAFKDNWSAMMSRLWESPENTLHSEAVHTAERIVVAQMAARIVQTDPSFSTIIFNTEDLTIPVIARHWASSTTPSDCYATGAFLVAMVFDPETSIPVKPNPDEVLQAFYRGVNTTATSESTKAKSAAVVVALHLNKLTGNEAVMELELCCLLHEASVAAAKSPAQAEFSRALRRNNAFWRNSFAVVRQVLKQDEDEPKLSIDSMRTCGCVVGLAASLIHMMNKEDEGKNEVVKEEREAMLNVWCKEGFFDFLDDIMSDLLQILGMTQQLARLFSCLDGFMATSTNDTLKQSFRNQFPRWKSLGTLVQYDMENQKAALDAGRLDLKKLKNSIPDPEDHTWVMIAWQMFAKVQTECMESDDICSRKDCRKTREGIICDKCKTTNYCSTECQDLDGKDGHQEICQSGLMDIVLGGLKPPVVRNVDLTWPAALLAVVLLYFILRYFKVL